MADTREGRRWPGYLFGGRVRTSTLALILAFVVIWWAYDSYGPETVAPDQLPAAEVVPPGFIPDPAYTWVPRTDVQRSPTTTTPTTTTSPTAPTTTTPAEDADADADTPTTTAGPTTTTSAGTSPTASPSPGSTPTTTPAATPATPTP